MFFSENDDLEEKEELEKMGILGRVSLYVACGRKRGVAIGELTVS